MADYQLTPDPLVVVRTVDGASIPVDPDNRDGAEYLAWLDAGGVPDPLPVPLGSAQFDWGPRLIQVIGNER